MPSPCSTPPTIFEDTLFAGQVSATVRALRVGAKIGEFERGCLNVTLTIWCKATELYYGEGRNQPEILIDANHLPLKMDAAVRFLEKLNISAFMPETAKFQTMDSEMDLIIFSARAGGASEEEVRRLVDQITQETAPRRDPKIPGLPYNEPMRPDLFFLKFRERFIADARNQLEGLVY